MASAPTTVRAAPVTATRIYDSLALGMAAGGTARDIQLRGLGGAPATASAGIVNLTATRRHYGTRTSNLDFVAARPTDGNVRVTAYNANTHVVVDGLALTLR